LKFAEVYSAIRQNFMESVDPDQVIFNGGIRGMLSSLDPFSAFFDRDQF
jgi:C-terminal processing protease CtpA/Prc